jgi:hypothetical protein
MNTIFSELHKLKEPDEDNERWQQVRSIFQGASLRLRIHDILEGYSLPLPHADAQASKQTDAADSAPPNAATAAAEAIRSFSLEKARAFGAECYSILADIVGAAPCAGAVPLVGAPIPPSTGATCAHADRVHRGSINPLQETLNAEAPRPPPGQPSPLRRKIDGAYASDVNTPNPSVVTRTLPDEQTLQETLQEESGTKLVAEPSGDPLVPLLCPHPPLSQNDDSKLRADRPGDHQSERMSATLFSGSMSTVPVRQTDVLQKRVDDVTIFPNQ